MCIADVAPRMKAELSAPTPSTPSASRADRASPRPCRVQVNPTPAGRHKLISEVAFEYAERRGFVPGYELEDWLAAEQEVDDWFKGELFSGD